MLQNNWANSSGFDNVKGPELYVKNIIVSFKTSKVQLGLTSLQLKIESDIYGFKKQYLALIES